MLRTDSFDVKLGRVDYRLATDRYLRALRGPGVPEPSVVVPEGVIERVIAAVARV